MLNRAKVLKGLKYCVSDRDCTACPYYDADAPVEDCTWALWQDANEMIITDAPKAAEWVFDRPHHFACSGCGYIGGVSATLWKFCPECGRTMSISADEMAKEWPKGEQNDEAGSA